MAKKYISVINDGSQDLTIKDKEAREMSPFCVFTCTTNGNTAAKLADSISGTNFVLRAGVVVAIKFSNTNTAQNPTLNVNGSGAYSVLGRDCADNYIAGKAGRTQLYYFDEDDDGGGQWMYIGVLKKEKDYKTLDINATSVTLDKDIHYNKSVNNYFFTVLLPNGYETGDEFEIDINVSGDCTITIHASIVWAKGDIPAFVDGKLYEISLKVIGNSVYGVYAEY